MTCTSSLHLHLAEQCHIPTALIATTIILTIDSFLISEMWFSIAGKMHVQSQTD